MVLPALPFGVRITIDGESVPESGLRPSLPPAHPGSPGAPTGFRHSSNGRALMVEWTAPLNWGDEDNPVVRRYYEVRYRTTTEPDDQTEDVIGPMIVIPADGAAEVTLLGVTAVNAAERRSHEVLLPVPIAFSEYTRPWGPEFGPEFG